MLLCLAATLHAILNCMAYKVLCIVVYYNQYCILIYRGINFDLHSSKLIRLISLKLSHAAIDINKCWIHDDTDSSEISVNLHQLKSHSYGRVPLWSSIYPNTWPLHWQIRWPPSPRVPILLFRHKLWDAATSDIRSRRVPAKVVSSPNISAGYVWTEGICLDFYRRNHLPPRGWCSLLEILDPGHSTLLLNYI